MPRKHSKGFVTLKLEPDVYAALCDVAASEERMVSKQATLFIKRGLEAHAKKLAETL